MSGTTRIRPADCDPGALVGDEDLGGSFSSGPQNACVTAGHAAASASASARLPATAAASAAACVAVSPGSASENAHGAAKAAGAVAEAAVVAGAKAEAATVAWLARAAAEEGVIGVDARINSSARYSFDGVRWCKGDSSPAGEGAFVRQALQRARGQRAKSRAQLTLQNVATDVPGSSSSHAVGTEAPSDRAAKRTSSIAANRQQQLNMLMALEEKSSCHCSDKDQHLARASSYLETDFEDPPEEAACSPTSRRLSVGQAMSSPMGGI